jgi:hypothetical protein
MPVLAQRLKRIGLWVLCGFLVGAFLGSSVGIAAGGSAQNGWLAFGLAGATFAFLLRLSINGAAPSTLTKETTTGRQFSPAETTEFRSLDDLTRALESRLETQDSIAKEVRLYEFALRNDLAFRNFAAEEIQRACAIPLELNEINKAKALADLLYR